MFQSIRDFFSNLFYGLPDLNNNKFSPKAFTVQELSRFQSVEHNNYATAAREQKPLTEVTGSRRRLDTFKRSTDEYTAYPYTTEYVTPFISSGDSIDATVPEPTVFEFGGGGKFAGAGGGSDWTDNVVSAPDATGTPDAVDSTPSYSSDSSSSSSSDYGSSSSYSSDSSSSYSSDSNSSSSSSD